VSEIRLQVTLSDEQLELIAQRAAELLAGRPAEDHDGWLNVEQAAKHLACPRSRIHDLVALRKLSPSRDGRRLLFRRADLDAYLEGST